MCCCGAFHACISQVASLICLELLLCLHFWGQWWVSRSWLPEAAAVFPTLCAGMPVRRGDLCLAGEDLAQGMLVTISYWGGGSLPTAAVTTVPPWLGASELQEHQWSRFTKRSWGLIQEVSKSLLAVALSRGDEHNQGTASTCS